MEVQGNPPVTQHDNNNNNNNRSAIDGNGTFLEHHLLHPRHDHQRPPVQSQTNMQKQVIGINIIVILIMIEKTTTLT